MNVAILGLGVVGRGVYDILVKDTSINVSYIIERDENKLKGLMHLKAPSFEHVLNDSNVDVIIELIGGKTIAYDFVRAALKAKKHVVTANKALISAYFQELHELASTHQVCLKYEASVAGATQLLTPIMRLSNINHFNHIYGIMNGTTNYVLTRVFKHNMTMKEAVLEAKALGYIETGSNDDMAGLDAMRKINILSMLAYHTNIDESDILVTPLDSITDTMISYLKSKGYGVKYIAESSLNGQQVIIHVGPLATRNPSIYDHIDNEMNMVTVEGKYHKKQAFIGQGAGRYPTATAIISDVMLIENKYQEPIHLNQTVEVNTSLKPSQFIVETLEGIMTIKALRNELIEREDIKCFVQIEEKS